MKTITTLLLLSLLITAQTTTEQDIKDTSHQNKVNTNIWRGLFFSCALVSTIFIVVGASTKLRPINRSSYENRINKLIKRRILRYRRNKASEDTISNMIRRLEVKYGVKYLEY